ncbi:preprotein translocase subunit YajC [Streptoalloteichus tenebrarius]|uniref:Preprotein translocase subunit YajC n=1 Tax=Streptoalloteichus tenebrarius (strain ATCC 17920 / DSM 40477 / JCM 4838 / CBS 697.72 / NBRC 16177 / NCIMB 11028 / NRRL B-12390 / A12253. 1 / ISP 5477) TaxID=1933 RepID=A0ABT1HS86_STRSD|nr:preprotein translocase subunit YajC [Streptoalloteichus tenebrarius]MCP2258386.1 preprotein translocase subunit YajC [Streptoalloteichus tenebrarius]BFF03553.1 preprotein translocase subunit YajC [Streptoalloteichus tenebrarius]
MDASFLFPLLIILLAVPLFLSTRKQKKMMQEMQALQNSLGPGDRVMTTSGLYGTVVGTDEDTLDVEIAPGVVTTWLRAAVREKVTTDTASTAATSDETSAADTATDKADGPQVAPPLEQGNNGR